MVRFCDERVAKSGLPSAQIDALFDRVVPLLTSSEEPEQANHAASAEITSTWGREGALRIFALSQLNPKRIFDESIVRTRQRAVRLDTARTISEVLLPEGITGVPSVHETFPTNYSLNGTMKRFYGLASKLSLARRVPALRAELYGEGMQIMQDHGLTENFVARIALSELQPAWVAERSHSSAFGIEKFAHLLRKSRAVAVHAQVVRGMLAAEGLAPEADL